MKEVESTAREESKHAENWKRKLSKKTTGATRRCGKNTTSPALVTLNGADNKRTLDTELTM